MPKPINVYFPCINANFGEIVEINCFASKELKGTIKVLSGIEEETAINIIGTSRQGEHHNNAGLGVIATVSNPNFHGNSYGLALAIADKLARYSKCKNINKIYATGEIKPNNNGDISIIDNINDKLSLVLNSIQKNDVFIFPRQCNDQNSNEQKELLQAILSKGARYYPISNISEGDNIFWCFDKNNKNPYQVNVKGSAIFIIIVGLLLYLFTQKEELSQVTNKQLVALEEQKIEQKATNTIENTTEKTSNQVLEPVAVPTDNY